MQYLSSYCRQQEEQYSLSLQQVCRRRGNLPVLFACICEEGEFMRQLTEWFHGKALCRCRKGSAEKVTERVRDSLLELCAAPEGDPESAFVLLFCAGGECFYAWRGDMDICVLNMQFGRARVRSLTRRTEGVGCGRAMFQEDVGLLLGAGDLFRRLPKEVLCSCLTVIDLNSQQQLDRHLSEVCGEAVRCGAKNTAAVLLAAKEEGDR